MPLAGACGQDGRGRRPSRDLNGSGGPDRTSPKRPNGELMTAGACKTPLSQDKALDSGRTGCRCCSGAGVLRPRPAGLAPCHARPCAGAATGEGQNWARRRAGIGARLAPDTASRIARSCSVSDQARRRSHRPRRPLSRGRTTARAGLACPGGGRGWRTARQLDAQARSFSSRHGPAPVLAKPHTHRAGRRDPRCSWAARRRR